MITGVKIDLTAFFNEFQNISQADGDEIAGNVVRHVASEFFNAWRETAKNSLSSSREQYLASLQLENESKTTTLVILHGKLPNMIESGFSGFDMKEGFAKSSNRKTTKDGGWYLTIPFRYATPGSLGESGAFAGVMPQEIYDEVKNFKPAKNSDIEVNGSIQSNQVWGDRLRKFDLPDKYGDLGTRPAFSSLDKPALNPKSEVEYEHKSPIFEGMVKTSKQYEKANQSMYNTFRRVSSNSDDNSWIHQGITAYNLAEKTMDSFDLERHRDVAIDRQLTILGL